MLPLPAFCRHRPPTLSQGKELFLGSNISLLLYFQLSVLHCTLLQRGKYKLHLLAGFYESWVHLKGQISLFPSCNKELPRGAISVCLPPGLQAGVLSAEMHPDLCATLPNAPPQIRSCPTTFSASHRKYSCKLGRFPWVTVYLASLYSSVGLSCVFLPSHRSLPPSREIAVSAWHMLEKQFYCWLSGSFW